MMNTVYIIVRSEMQEISAFIVDRIGQNGYSKDALTDVANGYEVLQDCAVRFAERHGINYERGDGR